MFWFKLKDFASGSGSKISIWTDDGTLVNEINLASTVNSIEFYKDTLIFVGSMGTTMRLIDFLNGTVIKTFDYGSDVFNVVKHKNLIFCSVVNNLFSLDLMDFTKNSINVPM